MLPAVRPLRSLSMARGYTRIDSRPTAAKIGSAGRLEAHRVRLLAIVGVRKTFPHGLGQKLPLTPPKRDFCCYPSNGHRRPRRHVGFVPTCDITESGQMIVPAP
jgi:hypothetical protein